MKTALIIRGLPGSGKTTLAQTVAPDANVAADQWFGRHNDGVFDPALLPRAHEWCFNMFASMIVDGQDIVAVHNTFTTRAEYEAYVDYAKQFGYTVHVMTIENVQCTESIHNVPWKTIDKMETRYELTL